MRILVVEEDAAHLRELVRMLGRYAGVRAFPTAEAAERILGAAPPDVVLASFHLPGRDGVELLATVKELHPGARRVLMSTTQADAYLDAIDRGVVEYFLGKPFTPDLLYAKLTLCGFAAWSGATSA